MKPQLALAILSLTAAAVRSQTVWTTSYNQNLGPVFGQASPGDIILLSSVHPPFTLNKGLVLIGPSGIFDIFGPGGTGGWNNATSIGIPAGQQARLVNVQFKHANGINGSLGHRVDVSGDASFESCEFGPGYLASLNVLSGTVVMHHCVVRGAAAGFAAEQAYGGMRTAGGTCAMTDCHLSGGPGFWHVLGHTVPSSPALRQLGGTLIASRVTAFGGAAVNSPFPIASSPAFHCSGTTYLTDSNLNGGSGGTLGPGATALMGNWTTEIAAPF